MRFLHRENGEILELPAWGSYERSFHVFDIESVDAINAALAARRPLLLRGEPGTGKSQLARAAAVALGRAFHSSVIDALTEPRDLLWRLDAVTRLAEAQLAGALGTDDEGKLRKRLAEEKFLQPGPVWWALDWPGAELQARKVGLTAPEAPDGWSVEHSVVLLIDEIDKADASVPNGLLEALGAGRFECPGGRVVGRSELGPPPLVMVTTNEERSLPDAFIRRCLVHHIRWPRDREKLIQALMARGAAHFSECSEQVLRRAAEMLVEDRELISARRLSPPGGAEYLDLLRAVIEMVGDSEVAARLHADDDDGRLMELLGRVGRYTLQKHPEEPGR